MDDILREKNENGIAPKIVFTTGGTGGHIYPALSIAKKMKEREMDVLFIGTKHRMEKDLVPAENFDFIGLDVIPLKSLSSVIKMIKATVNAIKILKKEKPEAVIGFGNYISIPVLLGANILRIPYYLQEQNCTMGLANKYFYKRSKKVFIAFKNTLDSIPKKYKEKFVVSGNPLREEFYYKNKEKDREKLGIKKDEKMIMVIGGSLGAKNINDVLVKKWKEISNENNVKFYWATGKDNYKEVLSRIKVENNNVVEPYFDNAADIMSGADLVICRAGASTISELIQLEKPSILIPYDFVGQKENADVLEYINSAKTYSNEEVEKAIEEALCLVKQKDMLNFMKENIKTLKNGNASEIILKEMGL